MPLPIILGVGAAIAGVVGVGSGISGASKMKEANDTRKMQKSVIKGTMRNLNAVIRQQMKKWISWEFWS